MTLELSGNFMTGLVYATEFAFAKPTFPSYTNMTWTMGDGTTYYVDGTTSKHEVKHTYDYPGTYQVVLSAWTQAGDLRIGKKTIDVDYYVRDRILFTQTPEEWNTPGQKTHVPFVVSLTSCNINQPLSLVFHAANSKSVPYAEIDDKWSFIVPTWRFVNANTNETIKGPIQLDTTPIYLNGTVVAVSATLPVYYLDYNSTINAEGICPVVITATLSTEQFQYPRETKFYPHFSYSNNETIKAVALCHVIDVVPTELKITENFIQQIYPIKWSNIPIPVMATCWFDPKHTTLFDAYPDISATDVFTYPKTNELGELFPVNLSLSGNNSANLGSKTGIYFEHTDDTGSLNSGYVYSTITPLLSANKAKILASTTLANGRFTKGFQFPVGHPINTSAYISHPFAYTINKLDVFSYSKDCTQIEYYKKMGFLKEGSIKTISVPARSPETTNNLSLSGNSGIFAVAYNPIKALLYVADSDENFLYAYNKKQELSYSVNLNSLFNKPISPSHICVDGLHNVWVSLYDSSIILKYDSSLNYLLSAQLPMFNDSFGLPFSTPPVIETDKNNDVYVCYNHPLSSGLAKFNKFGTKLWDVSLEYNTSPVSFNITNDNNVWTALREGNTLSLWSTNGERLSSFDFLKPSFVTLDRSENVWVVHGYNLLSHLNTETLGVSTWQINTRPVFKYEMIRDSYIKFDEYSLEERELASSNDEVWGGLASDVLNRIWFINSESNIAGVFLAAEPENVRFATLTPSITSQVFVDSPDNLNITILTEQGRSAQASGDWTGNKWYQKYASSTLLKPVSGSSNEFTILNKRGINSYGPLQGIDFSKIAKVNEGFNYAEYFRSLALPELLAQNVKLFEEFLPSLLGNGSFEVEDLGKTFYERIANFVTNHGDVDTAEIKQLISLAEKLSEKAKTYAIEFPVEIQKLLNLFSIQLNDLRGMPVFDETIENNIESVLTNVDYVSADQFLYARDKKYNTIQLIQIGKDRFGNSVFPISAIEINGLRGNPAVEAENTNFNNYYFFSTKPKPTTGYKNNIIDWMSPHTTLSYNLSTSEEFYKTDGIVELYFNNLLSRKLFE